MFLALSLSRLLIFITKVNWLPSRGSSFQLSMMSSFPAKLMAAVLAIFLLVGDFSATSALLPYGNNSFHCYHFSLLYIWKHWKGSLLKVLLWSSMLAFHHSMEDIIYVVLTVFLIIVFMLYLWPKRWQEEFMACIWQ